MVGEPRHRPLAGVIREQHALRPGEFNVYDRQGRLFTTANDRGYAVNLAARLNGRCTRTVFGEEQEIDQ